MASPLLLLSAFICLVTACSSTPEHPKDHGSPPVDDDSGNTDQRDLATSQGAQAVQGGQAGQAGNTRKTPVRATPEASSGSAAAGSAGASSESESDPLPPPDTSCDLDGSCITDCKDRRVTCGIETNGPVYCEFQGFTGATAQVACNQRAVIGMACCGGCGCIPVEVYFDGKYCWQGMPECSNVDSLSNRMLEPHLPTNADSSYTLPGSVPGSFTLGSGGFAGSQPDTGIGGVAGNEPATTTGGTAGSEPATATGGVAGSEPATATGGVAGNEPVTAAGGVAGDAAANSFGGIAGAAQPTSGGSAGWGDDSEQAGGDSGSGSSGATGRPGPLANGGAG